MFVTDSGIKISDTINKLIAQKSERDNVSFTCYKLAKAINVDRSLVQRLVNGEIENPRLDTLAKIINFFISDGFQLSLEDIMRCPKKVFDVQSEVVQEEKIVNLPLYQMSNFTGEKLGTTAVITTGVTTNANTIAIAANESLLSFVQAGSIFIVELDKVPEHNNLIMVKMNDSINLALKKVMLDDERRLRIQSVDGGCSDGEYLTNFKGKIIGVVTRINVKV